MVRWKTPGPAGGTEDGLKSAKLFSLLPSTTTTPRIPIKRLIPNCSFNCRRTNNNLLPGPTGGEFVAALARLLSEGLSSHLSALVQQGTNDLKLATRHTELQIFFLVCFCWEVFTYNYMSKCLQQVRNGKMTSGNVPLILLHSVSYYPACQVCGQTTGLCDVTEEIITIMYNTLWRFSTLPPVLVEAQPIFVRAWLWRWYFLCLYGVLKV